MDLVFAGSYGLTEGAVGVGTAKMLRLNAPYDVDPSLGSTAVPGFNEMAALYYSYRVHKVSVDCNMSFYGSTGGGAFGEISLFPTAQSSVPSNASAWRVQRHGVTRTVYPAGAGSGLSVPRLRLDIDIPKFLNISRTQYLASPWYSALCTSIPTTLVFCAVCLRSTGSSTAASAIADIRVAMRIQFYDPIPQSN